jgi:malate/lactate dehydrogenase
VDRSARDLGIAPARLVGSAPEAVASTARALIALTLNGSPRDVAVTVIGEPPSRTIVTWSDGTFAGQPLTRVLDEPVRRQLARRIAAAWPPGPLALAAAAAKAIACIDGRCRQLTSCFVAPDRSHGERNKVAALPVRLGPGGIVGVMMPVLSAGEQVAFDNALLV